MGRYRQYAPSSAGTYLDDKNKEISATEAGGYLQLDTMLTGRLRLAGAARADHHSLYATQISPKAAVQYEVAPSTTFASATTARSRAPRCSRTSCASATCCSATAPAS